MFVVDVVVWMNPGEKRDGESRLRSMEEGEWSGDQHRSRVGVPSRRYRRGWRMRLVCYFASDRPAEGARE